LRIVVIANILYCHFLGTAGGILIIVKKTLQAFPVRPPVFVKHWYPWYSPCLCACTVRGEEHTSCSTGFMTYEGGSQHLLTVVGGLMQGSRGSRQLSGVMTAARCGPILVGNFGRPPSAFATIEKAPFVQVVESGFLGILAQSSFVVPGSTGCTRAADGYLASVFATLAVHSTA
jgi:hypothetical protein